MPMPRWRRRPSARSTKAPIVPSTTRPAQIAVGDASGGVRALQAEVAVDEHRAGAARDQGVLLRFAVGGGQRGGLCPEIDAARSGADSPGQAEVSAEVPGHPGAGPTDQSPTDPWPVA